ncbi:hypothetical protein INH39_21165 [Massilia violaceinigra]|uniref:Uncharacterized protein n=1 Tax=Massilia violaceinigra TaxID=2045208 RepID=A0ABY3ZZR5_9BURK|nr:hypothetical protein [Massilia violaceinigra]UOD27980.1 hypothetical protein INH39_21165 [Massilia violaceinigra]
MRFDFLKRHVQELQREAQQTSERSIAEPDNFWLRVAANNQKRAALDALQELDRAYLSTKK